MDRPLPPGALLLSVPQMLDPNFMHSVVLLVEHNSEGALGLTVNQATTATLGELGIGHPVLDACDFPVFSGGPVGRDNLQFVHRMPGDLPGGLELDSGVFLGGELSALADCLESGKATADNLRFFVGYSGWGAGQLDDEFDTGSWVPAPSSATLCFSQEDGEAVWRAAMRSLGDAGEALSQIPPDVTWN